MKSSLVKVSLVPIEIPISQKRIPKRPPRIPKASRRTNNPTIAMTPMVKMVRSMVGSLESGYALTTSGEAQRFPAAAR